MSLWEARYRRLGPLRYSDLGPRRSRPLPGGEVDAVAGWIAGVADSLWCEAGRPDPYTVAVVASDDGAVARSLLQAGPACLDALRYVAVVADPAAREALGRSVPLEAPAFLYPLRAAGGPEPGAAAGELDDTDGALPALDDTDGPPQAPGAGPLVATLAELPPAPGAPADPQATVVVAVEALSALPFDLYRRAGRAWEELRLVRSADGWRDAGLPVEELPDGPADPARDLYARPGGALAWLAELLSGRYGGRLVAAERWSGPDVQCLPEALPVPGLAQLARVRRPERAGPQPIAGTGLSAASWRLG